MIDRIHGLVFFLHDMNGVLLKCCKRFALKKEALTASRIMNTKRVVSVSCQSPREL